MTPALESASSRFSDERRSEAGILDACDLERRLTRLGPADLCQRLALISDPHGAYEMIRCPWHPDDDPSASVSLGDNGTIRVHCFACDETHDVHDLIAAVRGLDVEEDFPDVLRVESALLADECDQSDQAPSSLPDGSEQRARTYPSASELGCLWGASLPVDLVDRSDPEDQVAVCAFLRGRGIDPKIVRKLDVARRLPPVGVFKHPPWLPAKWVWNYRLAVLGYDASGIPRSIHVRAVQGTGKAPKSLWPKGRRSTGLVFLNNEGRRMLKSPAHHRASVVFTEGVPDFLAACAWAATEPSLSGAAVVGVGSWSRALYEQVLWPPSATYSIFTHADETGRKYASQILAALPSGAATRVVDLGEVAGSGAKVDLDQADSDTRARSLDVRLVEVEQLRGSASERLDRDGQGLVERLRKERKDALRQGQGAWLGVVEKHLREAPPETRQTVLRSSIGALLRRGVEPARVTEFVGLATGLAHDEVRVVQRGVAEWISPV